MTIAIKHFTCTWTIIPCPDQIFPGRMVWVDHFSWNFGPPDQFFLRTKISVTPHHPISYVAVYIILLAMLLCCIILLATLLSCIILKHSSSFSFRYYSIIASTHTSLGSTSLMVLTLTWHMPVLL